MYMAPGSADCQYAIRELTTGIKELKVADMQGGTCKAPNPQRISKLEEAQNIWSILECYSDTPWGNCKRRRKPTACGGSKISTCVFWLDRRIVLSLYYCTANYLDSWGCQPRCESIWIQVRQEEFPEASSRKSQALRSKEPVGATGAAPEEVFISSEGKWQCG